MKKIIRVNNAIYDSWVSLASISSRPKPKQNKKAKISKIMGPSNKDRQVRYPNKVLHIQKTANPNPSKSSNTNAPG